MSRDGKSRLDAIVAARREDVAVQQRYRPLEMVVQAARNAPRPPDFLAALHTRRQLGQPALIAEIKRASPSKGDLSPGLEPVTLAGLYAHNGAAAVSVLTETRHFKGSLEDLERVATALPGLPLLRKDFIFDPYQIYEARAAGAAAVLLIAACLERGELDALQGLAKALGLAALVEVHDQVELEMALSVAPNLVGINNRNLHDFSVSLETTRSLRRLIPPEVVVVAESGIHTREDVRSVAEAGVDAILVGEALVTAKDVAGQVRLLAGGKVEAVERG